MNIINFIQNQNYYVTIDKKFKKILLTKFKNRKTDIDMNVSYNTIYRILHNDNYFSHIDTFISLCNELNIPRKRALASITFIKTKMSFPIPVKNIVINKPFLRIISHLLGDGGIHVDKKEGKYRAFYVNNEKSLLDSFIRDIKKVFGEIKIYKRKRIKHGDEVWVPTSLGFILYSILDYPEQNNKKRIPKFICKINNRKLLGVFLQAFYDDEGYLYPHKNMIVLSQKSYKLLNDIRKVVTMIGISPNKILIHKAKNRSKMYYFTITHKNNFMKFNELIGFTHPEKKRKLKLLMNKYGGR